MTEPAGPYDWRNFQLGDYVADKDVNGRIVVDIDAGTALPPYKASDWKHYQRGVMIKSRRYGIVHCSDRKSLEPSGPLADVGRYAAFGCLLVFAIAFPVLALLVNPWGGIRHGKDWTCPPVPPSAQICTRGVPTPTP